MAERRRLRSNTVALGITLIAAATLTACGDDGSRICVDPNTEVRVDDDLCDDIPDNSYYGDGSHYPYYPLFITSGHSAPAVGGHYSATRSGFYYKAPSGKTFSKSSVSVKGGTVKSGGFGGGFGRASS